MKTAIIADDLTGASDAAVGFAAVGYRSAVVLDPDAADLGAADVVAVDTESRGLEPAEAAERVASATRRVAGADMLMKKIDSTLRGPVAAEVMAALAESGRATAVVAPAFPAYGRTTRHGIQHLDGTPVHRTAMRDDPVAPVRSSDLRALLALDGGHPIVAAGRPRRALGGLLAKDGIVVVDVETERDLDALVAMVTDPGDVLWVGSTGLARALGRGHPAAAPAPVPHPGSARRVLVVVGSVNPVARRQLGELASAHQPTCHWLTAPGLDVRHEPGGDDLLLVAPEPGGDASPETVAAALAEVARRLVDSDRADGLVLTGGDTAIAVARGLGATGIAIGGEVEVGIPFGTLTSPAPLPVVTKAGGFGGPDALVTAVRALSAVEALR
jgi:D-threonate/D-erythronate kinase